MPDRLILIDVSSTIVKDLKDVSEYVFEAIRSRYGLEPQFKLDDYEGVPAQLMVSDILEKNGVTKEEINSRLAGCVEELGYSYYNVVGREAITVLGGAKQLLDELTKRGVIVGIATGDVEEIVKNKLQRAHLTEYFKFGEYGNNENDFKRIIERATERAKKEFGLDANCAVWVVASYPQIIKGAKAAGAKAIGVTSSRYSKDELAGAGADEVVGSVKDRGKIVKTILR
jgi:phosphoglycolate phosphatase-like HAD superfamily hydrolase